MLHKRSYMPPYLPSSEYYNDKFIKLFRQRSHVVFVSVKAARAVVNTITVLETDINDLELEAADF